MSDCHAGSNKETAAEEWRPVVGYEGWYEVSDRGGVRRVLALPRHPPGPLDGTVGKIGYRVVALSGGVKTRLLYVHRLVVEAFLGPIPKGMTVNHKDLVKTNNHVGNLEVISRKENTRHAARLGAIPHGERQRCAKLTAAQVVQIRRLKGVHTTRDVGKLFGISCCVVSLVQNRKIWRHVR